MKGVGERHSYSYRWARANLRLLRRRLRQWERYQIRNMVLVLVEPGLHTPDPEEFIGTPLSPIELNLTGRTTIRALFYSASLHVLLVSTPLPDYLLASFAGAAPVQPEVEDARLATSNVLPPIFPRRMPKSRPSPGGTEGQPLPPLGAEARRRR
jgi:hypothetical protein